MPQKQGIEALRAIHKKNPRYFDQFTQEADRRAVEVLGPLFGVDHKSWQRFRQEYLGSDAERQLEALRQQLSGLLGRFAKEPQRPSAGRKVRGRVSRGSKPRLTAEVKQARKEAKKLRLEAHRLVLRVAKKRDVSPAVVYAELTKKFGHPAREADVKELQERIALLKPKA